MSARESKSGMNSSQVDHDLRQEPTPFDLPVVRQLKPPPEIWELVQPVPLNQSRIGRGFITRLASGRTMFILLVVVIVCAGGYLGIRSGKRIARTTNTPAEKPRQVDLSTTANAASETPTQQSNTPTPVVAASVDEPTTPGQSEKPKRKASPRSKPIEGGTEATNRPIVSENVSSAVGSDVSLPNNQKTRPLTNTTQTAGASSVDAVSSKPKTSLSPQLIDSPKTTPRKSKVIQWP